MKDTLIVRRDNGMRFIVPLGVITIVSSASNDVLYDLLWAASKEKGLKEQEHPDSGVHYSQLGTLWRGMAAMYKKGGIQVVATSARLESIVAAHKVLGANLRYVRLDMGEDGEVTVVEYSTETLAAALDVGIEIR